ncbi:hypothetical protein Pla111_30880 [Botrimarina hoheduenensis]|uniref:Uncharacterized protein n=1 Tax=Botrimarina hoheduenensis TaxID=2528000 RepID=A0A5C5VRV1_9BACT|nr:hypothetical protein Pla111_30880 [Botrimarina hoheduenensis]
MTAYRDKLPFTAWYDDPLDFTPKVGAVYVARDQGIEDRASHSARLQGLANVTYASVVAEERTSVTLRVGASGVQVYPLRSTGQLGKFWAQFTGCAAYIDITGLRHHVWMPLLRTALFADVKTHVVYVEPREYQASVNPTEGQIYDLSEKIEGVEPIPGLASFSRVTDSMVFAPLLGFEGTRVAHLLEQIQPAVDRVFPVIGVPGFRAEYPFSTYLGNRVALQQSDSWRQVRFADASCPFSLFWTLEKLASEESGCHIKVAPVGTKPHAVGALLFVVGNTAQREIVYDHPIRKAKRTTGASRLLVYDIDGFLSP